MAFAYTKQRQPFQMEAVVILPDHLHCVWTLPPGDTDFSTRWNLPKGYFFRSIEKGERISNSRAKRRERGLWQRRFWEHCVRDQEDFNNHLDYIHWNPVKHGWAKQAAAWPYSSFQRFVTKEIDPSNWGSHGIFDVDGGGIGKCGLAPSILMTNPPRLR